MRLQFIGATQTVTGSKYLIQRDGVKALVDCGLFQGQKHLQGAKEVKIHGRQVPVNAETVCLDNLSAHADQGEILDWLSHFKRAPRKVFITHGEPESARALAEAIRVRFGWECKVPDYLEQVRL